MKKHIAVLSGDGIGPEIVPQALKVLKAIGQRSGHDFDVTFGPSSLEQHEWEPHCEDHRGDDHAHEAH